ncbi:MAG: penicillin-binding transpeptidase domain-containing protein [Myxococcota bacterium]
MTKKRRRESRLLGSFGRSGENFRHRPRPAPKKEKDPKRSAARRVLWVGGGLVLGAVALLGRAYQLQIVTGSHYDDAARRQTMGSETITAKRGVIKDRHGAELAITVDVDSIYAEPRRVKDPAEVARKLASVLSLDSSKLLEQLTSERAFVYLKRRVGSEEAAAVKALELAGIGARPEPRRFFPNRELAAHVIGFTDGEGVGRAGVEKAYDETLRGQSYQIPALRDALGNQVLSEGFVPEAVLEGDDVVLTIDRQIQYAAETELEKSVKENEAAAGVAIVLEPKTGDLLAMASWPPMNPNDLSSAKDGADLNRATSAVFEPGSTLKMVTISAGLEEKKIVPSDKIDCENGKWRVGGRTIGDTHHYGLLQINEIMKVSSNICSAKIGLMLGKERLYDWLTRFGFGSPTGVPLPGELGGLLRPAQSWREITLANVAFGQGLSVTPLQIAQAATVIANGGIRVKPRLVLGTVDKAGTPMPAGPVESERVLSEGTARLVRDMMIEVTHKGGTAEVAAIPGFTVAGKTGTSQKIDPVTKAYSRSLYVGSFVGFVPAEKPEVLVLVLIDEPKKAYYGGTVAAPAFKAIAMAALSARSIFPEEASAREAFLASYRRAVLPSESLDAASKHPDIPSDSALDGALSPAARAVVGAETPRGPRAARPSAVDAEPALSSGESALVGAMDAPDGRKAGEGLRMPNFAGLGLSEVLNRRAEVHCDLVLSGAGKVVGQTPSAGTAIEAGQRCELHLSPRG